MNSLIHNEYSLWRPCYFLYFKDVELFHTSIKDRFDKICQKLRLVPFFLEQELQTKEYQMIGQRNGVSNEFLDLLEDLLSIENDEKILDVLNCFYEYQVRLFNRLPIVEQRKLNNKSERDFRNRMVD